MMKIIGSDISMRLKYGLNLLRLYAVLVFVIIFGMPHQAQAIGVQEACWNCRDGCTYFWDNIGSIVPNGANAYCSSHGGVGAGDVLCDAPNWCPDHYASVTNGVCGAANNGNDVSAPSTNLCNTGTASAVASASGGWTWSCAGSGGGTTASCAATLSSAVNGTCGAANNATYSSAPQTASYLCSTGTASAVSGTNTWSWSCAGSNGGSTSSCTATNCAPVTGYVSAITTNTVMISAGVVNSGACSFFNGACPAVYSTTATPSNVNYNGYTVSSIYAQSQNRAGFSTFSFAVTSPSGYAPQALFSNITIYDGSTAVLAVSNSSMTYSTSLSNGVYTTTWADTVQGSDLTFYNGTSITVQ